MATHVRFKSFGLAPKSAADFAFLLSTAEAEKEIDLSATHKTLLEIEKQITITKAKYNTFVKELVLDELP